MVKPEWGTKRTCPKCGTRFYDLGNEDPVTCIECENTWTPEPVLKSKQPIPFEEEKKKKDDEADSDLVDSLLEQRSARELAAMLVSAHRAKLPEPEDLIANTPEAHRAAKAERHRPGFEDTAWFRMDIGRRRNADPRWILPLLCRRGHITRNEVGAIRIGPNETYFQIPRAIADKFADAVNRTAGDGEDGEDIRIEASATGPRDAARTNRKAPPGTHRDGKPKPHRKNFGGKPKGDFKGNRPNKPPKGAKKKDR